LIKGRSCFKTHQSNTSSQSEGCVGEKNVAAWDHFEEGQRRKKAFVLVVCKRINRLRAEVLSGN